MAEILGGGVNYLGNAATGANAEMDLDSIAQGATANLEQVQQEADQQLSSLDMNNPSDLLKAQHILAKLQLTTDMAAKLIDALKNQTKSVVDNIR